MPAWNKIPSDGCLRREQPLEEEEFSEEIAGLVEWRILNPNDIKYTQKCISFFFTKRGTQAGTGNTPHSLRYSKQFRSSPHLSIEDTLRQLRNGSLKVDQIPQIRVCKFKGKWYSLDNRRLWVFKEYGQDIRVAVLPLTLCSVWKEFFQKFDSRETNGETVTRLNPGMAERDDKDTFLSAVLKWSIENVRSKRLYVNKVRHIGEEFRDFEEYCKAFKWPLLEDTRAQLQESLEDIGSKPWMQLCSIKDTTKDKDMDKSRLRTLDVIAQAGNHAAVEKGKLDKVWIPKRSKSSLGRQERGGEEKRNLKSQFSIKSRGKMDAPWIPKSTDLVLLTTSVPEKLEGFGKSGELYSFAEIVSTNDCSPVLKIKAWMHPESPVYLAIGEEKRTWHLVFLDTLATRMRIWEALVRIADPASAKTTSAVAKEILSSVSIKESKFDCNVHQKTVLEESVRKYCNFRGLNESQSKAVTTPLMSLMTETDPHVHLIQGPPGTGKTHTITTALSIASSMKEKRVLVCAPTNRAISEVAERFLINLSANSQFSDIMPLHEERRLTCGPLQLGDVVFVGNDERIDTDGPLDKIFLPSRMKRLNDAISPHCGWTFKSNALAEFLQHGLREFHKQGQGESEGEEKVGNEGNCKEQVWRTSQEHCGKGAQEQLWELNQTKFLGFVRDTLYRIGESMITYGEVICKDLPTEMLSQLQIDRKKIGDLRILVESLLKAITADNLLEADIMQILAGRDLSHQPASPHGRGSLNSKAKDFYFARKHLLEQIPISGASVRNLSAIRGLEDRCLRSARVMFCTTSSAGRWCVRGSGPFNFAVVDEAGQLIEAETTIITQLPGLERLLLVGDPKQLPAVVKSENSKICGYGRSLFERLQTSDYPCHLLNEQYRMHPAISDFPSRQFYQGAIMDGLNVKSQTYMAPYQKIYGSFAFIDVKDSEEERYKKTSRGWMNSMEAEVVHHLIMKIRSVPTGTLQDADIGVITPYRRQADLIQETLKQSGIVPRDTGTDQLKSKIAVKTVDGFQGGEKDAIIFSAVRANEDGNIGFLDDSRRLNVALTRARFCNWIVGNATTLGQQNPLWKALISDACQKKCFWSASKRKRDGQICITRVLPQENVKIMNGLAMNAEIVKSLSTGAQNVKDLSTSVQNGATDALAKRGDARSLKDAMPGTYRPIYAAKIPLTNAHNTKVPSTSIQTVSVDTRTMGGNRRASQDVILDIDSLAAVNVHAGSKLLSGDIPTVYGATQEVKKHSIPNSSDKQRNRDSCTRQRPYWLDLCVILSAGAGVIWIVSKMFGGRSN